MVDDASQDLSFRDLQPDKLRMASEIGHVAETSSLVEAHMCDDRGFDDFPRLNQLGCCEDKVAAPASSMPSCGCLLTGVEDEWAACVELVTRLTKGDRLLVPSGSDGLKPCNADAAHNALVLKPLLKRVAEQCGWELFSLPEVTKRLFEFINCRQDMYTQPMW